MKKLLLVDGYSMLFRAYYATAYGKKMTTSSGVPTNAIFGFANMIQKAIDIVQPDSILVAFDAGKHTFRHDLYKDYKGGRKPAPEDLVPQFQFARDYLDSFHIKWVEKTDIEADDIIGSISKQSTNYQTVILSSDHDLLQLVDDTTSVLLMKKGISEVEEMTPQKMKEEMGITPLQIIDLKGLMGDHSDNIPGIPGVGEKTAIKLLNEYGSVENVLAHDNEVKGALGQKIQDNHEIALLSKQLATIKRDVELDFTADDCAFHPDYKSLITFLKSLEMNSLVNRYSNESFSEEVKKEDISFAYEHVSKCPKDFYSKNVSIYLDASNGSFLTAQLHGISLFDGKKAVYLTVEELKKEKDLLTFLKEEKKTKIGFDIKRAYHILDSEDLTVHFSDDAMIVASLANSTLTSIDKIFDAFNLHTSLSYEDVYGKTNKPKLPDIDEQTKYACENARNIYLLFEEVRPLIKEYEMEYLYQDIELPLTDILYEMEKTGIICDAKLLEEISLEMKKSIDQEQANIYQLSKREFNINSPKQLAEILYDDLGLPSGKKRSTSADVLEKLLGIHPIIEHLMTYRKLQKIYSTYAEGLQKYIYKDGRIHTLYNQCVTQTGRLSSSEPNLQNISVRDEQGRMIRKAFLPSEGNVLISSDYHQIELRMLAHMANEPSLIEAFNSGIDIHTKTAMDVFGVKEEDVDANMRRRAKTVNFGIVYGISDFGLAEQLGISRKEASDFIASYYKSYPKIQQYMNDVIASCEKKGYVTTLSGRRREIPQINDKNHMIKEFGKRAAMNAPIQGSAADLIKIAMIHIDEAMKKANVKSKMILQVHDELIFDVPKDEVKQMKELIDDGMVHAMKLSVPLTAECSIGKNWYEAK
ncbi:MAG: DNA polymerase I [Solobacterium sp.]|nr:DNA polymerase I [Solobacterium sp.]